MKRQLLFLGIASVGATALSAVVAMLVMAFALLGDVGALQKQARNATRMAKALQTDIAALKDRLASAKEGPIAAEALSRPIVSAVAPVQPVAVAPARIIKASAVTSSGCVFRPGDVDGLANCIRSYQWPQAKMATPRYR